MTLANQTKHRGSLIRLLQAARGQYIPNEASETHPLNKLQEAKRNKKNITPLPCFPLQPRHIRIIPSLKSSTSSHDSFQHPTSSSPEDFHAHLCKSILKAKRRVKLATLYIGAGNGCMSISTNESSHSYNPPREEQLLQHLRQISNREEGEDSDSDVEIKIVMDASRGLRPIKIIQNSNQNSSSATTSSAKEVFYSLFPDGVKDSNQKEIGISLFNVHSGLTASLPSPLNEILGVFHLKVYIIDDELILSGANLSEEYFTDRLDRYISFVGGANGLVDFYSDLVDILYEHSTEYNPSTSDDFGKSASSKLNETSLTKALCELFDGTKSSELIRESRDGSCNEAFAFAVPTFQPSQSFLKQNELSFPLDIEVTRNLMFTVLDCYHKSKVHVSSAYLNPTPFLMSAIEKFGSKNNDSSSQTDKENIDGAAILLSASPKSHGFKQKKKEDAVNGSGRGWIPSAFLKLAEELHTKIAQNGGKILLYERDGFTFHAKGIWLTSGDSGFTFEHSPTNTSPHNCKIHAPESNLLATIFGSSNFGSRSEALDYESNCIVVINPSSHGENATKAKNELAVDWNSMLDYSMELGSKKDLQSDQSKSISTFIRDVALQVARKFF